MDRAAGAVLQLLLGEMERLRGRGFPSGYTWSDILVPIAWLSLPLFCRSVLWPGLLQEGVGLGPLSPARGLLAAARGCGA